MKLLRVPRIQYGAVVLAFTAVMGVGASAPAVTAEAVDAKVTVADGAATATFAIKLTNSEASAVSGLSVEFSDGSSVSAADLAPGQSGTTAVQQKVFTYPEGSSRSFPVPVTLKFVLEGMGTESAAVLYFHVQ